MVIVFLLLFPGFILLLSILWTFVVGFVFYVRCIRLLRFMVLKPLLSLCLVYVGSGLLLVRLLCLVVSVWPTLVLFWLFLTALPVLILGFILFGVAFGCCVGTWRIFLLCMSFPGSIVFYGSSLLVLLGMVRFVYCCPVLCLLGFLGIRIHVFGLGLVCLLFVRSLALFSFFGRLFGMLGELWLLVTLFSGWLSGWEVSGLSRFFEAFVLASPERSG